MHVAVVGVSVEARPIQEESGGGGGGLGGEAAHQRHSSLWRCGLVRMARHCKTPKTRTLLAGGHAPLTQCRPKQSIAEMMPLVS